MRGPIQEPPEPIPVALLLASNFPCLFDFSEVHDVAWSPDDRFAVTACIDNSLNLWRVDAATAQKPAFTSWHNGVPRSEQSPLATWKAHNNWVRGVAWDPLGKVRCHSLGLCTTTTLYHHHPLCFWAAVLASLPVMMARYRCFSTSTVHCFRRR